MRALALVLLMVVSAGCSTELGPVKCTGDDTCGAGTYCGADAVCAQLPTCGGAQALCGHTCATTGTDLANCGRCGNACSVPAGGSATCSAGACGHLCGANLVISADGCALPAPAGLSAAGGQGQISLSWTPVTGATGYAVGRAASAAGPFTALGTSATASFTDTSVQPATTWFYVVHATGAAGLLVVDSAPVSALTTPAAPAHLVATGGVAEIALTWDAVSGATSYSVLRASSAAGPFLVSATGTTTGATDSGLDDGATWFYQVLASNASGASLASTVASATTAAGPVAPVVSAPAFLTAADSGTASVPARAGFSYLWSLAGAGTIVDSAGTTSAGVNTVSFAANALATGTLTLSCLEVNSAGHRSAAGTAAVGVAAVPVKPSITAPAGVAPGATATASVPARAGMTYTWTVTSGSSAALAGVTASGVNTLTFTAASSGAVGLTCTETNAANKRSSAATASVPIVPLFTLNVSGSGTGSGAITTTGLSPNLSCSYSGTTSTGTCSVTLPSGTGVTLTATAGASARFAGWSNACTGTTCAITLGANATAVAAFVATVPVTVTLAGLGSGTVTSTPPGITCGATCSGSFDAGTNVTLNAVAGGGSGFTGFSGDCTGVTCTLASLGGASNVTATFVPQHTISVTANGTGGGSVSSSPAGINACAAAAGACAAAFNDGSPVVLTATPTGGAVFTGWTGAGCAGTGTCSITLSGANASTTATFTAQHSITATVTGNGTVSSSPSGINTCAAASGACTATFNDGSPVVLTATPASGSVFSGWNGGGCVGTGTCSITLSGSNLSTAGAFASQVLATARAQHNAVLLPSGKVLVVGGYGPNASRLKDAELYDPATKGWSPAGSVTNSLWNASVTRLTDGRIFVAGGFYDWPASLYANTWFYTEAQGWTAGTPLPKERAFHNAILLPSGKVLIVTGTYPNYLCSYPLDAQLFDPTANAGAGSWTATGPTHVNRSSAGGALLKNGKVLLTGGNVYNCPSNNPGYSQSEQYDPSTGLWTAAGSMTTGRGVLDLVALATGDAIAIGGANNTGALSSVDRYDTATNAFVATGPLVKKRQSGTATLLPSGKVVVTGGYDGAAALTGVEVFDPAFGTWSTGLTQLTTARWNHTATLLPSGKLLVVGGYTLVAGASVFLDSAELLDEGQ